MFHCMLSHNETGSGMVAPISSISYVAYATTLVLDRIHLNYITKIFLPVENKPEGHAMFESICTKTI